MRGVPQPYCWHGCGILPNHSLQVRRRVYLHHHLAEGVAVLPGGTPRARHAGAAAGAALHGCNKLDILTTLGEAPFSTRKALQLPRMGARSKGSERGGRPLQWRRCAHDWLTEM